MKMNKNLLLAGVVTTVAAGSLLSLGVASADSASGDSLIDKIATKFSLNRDEVEAVFDEEQTERQAERAADFSENLQDKVDSGDITAEQKTLIEAKFAEIQAARDSEHDVLEKWAETNGIDMKYIMGGHGRGGMGGSDRLEDAVADGDITAEQKTLIEAKHDELETAREAARDELEQWADDNGIELKDVMGGMGGHGRGGMGGPGMMR